MLTVIPIKHRVYIRNTFTFNFIADLSAIWRERRKFMKKFYVVFRNNRRKVLGMTVYADSKEAAAYNAEMKVAITLSNLTFNEIIVEEREDN